MINLRSLAAKFVILMDKIIEIVDNRSKYTKRPTNAFSLRWTKISGGPLKGCFMLLDPNSNVSWHYEMSVGKFDDFIYKEIKKLNLQNKTIWDIGAHVGYHSLAFASLMKQGSVIAFEPNSYNIQRLKDNVKNNLQLTSKITILKKALSNKDGFDEFVFSPEIDNGRSSGSHLREAIPPRNAEVYGRFKRKKIRVYKIDSIIKDKKIPIPVVIKIDVEGGEYLVLQGAKRLIKKHKPALFIEVHNITNMFYIQKLLTGLGYKIKLINEKNTTPSRGFVMAF